MSLFAPAADLKNATDSSEKQFHDNETGARVLPTDGHKVSVAECLWYAQEQREKEALMPAPVSRGLATFFATKQQQQELEHALQRGNIDDPLAGWDTTGLTERQIELNNARRVLRMAGWGAVFYLITCDILGPFSAPYAIAQIGLVPGVTLYILFGIFAIIAGFVLCKLFCRLDSIRYPVKTYGDLADRLFGSWARHSVSLLQAIQLIINCGIICLSNGQSLSQMSAGGQGGTPKLCFVICILIFALFGMLLGQVRSLKGFGLIANASVWLNVLIMVLSMGFVAHSAPNYSSAIASYGYPAGYHAPVSVSAVVPLPVFTQVNGVFNMVFAYGGAMIFPEIMAEMRRPRDFIKGAAMAQLFIMLVYLFYGVFVYCFQGQYTLPLAYQGVSVYSWQTIGNAIAVVTGAIAAGLYGNIGLKVFYIHIVEDLFRGPPLMSTKGRFLWSVIVFVWWCVAFVIGAGIPAVGALSGLVAAVCIFQFTYTFPPLFMLALDMHIDAATADTPFVPGEIYRQADSWKQVSRWSRGFFGGGRLRLTWKCLNVIYFLGALATSGLGMWATGTDLKASYDAGAASSFGCAAAV